MTAALLLPVIALFELGSGVVLQTATANAASPAAQGGDTPPEPPPSSVLSGVAL